MGLSTSPPSGFRDFSPEICALRSRAIETISRVYRSFGFQPIDTPAVEDLAVLLGKGGGENEKLIFKLLKRGEKLEAAKASGEDLADLGLRFDLTLPLARFYSKNAGTLPHPFKAFHIGPVWRAERAQRGRYREFYQCDADVIGSESIQAEIDVIQAILAAFKEFGLGDVQVKLNDRRLLFSLLDHAGVPEAARVETCVLLDKLDKMDPSEVFAEIKDKAGERAAEALRKLSGAPDTSLLRQLAREPMARLEAISGLIGKGVELSPMLVRGFDYYTSTVFEFRHPKFSGSIGGGGRYDRLTEKFGGQSVPACGASIGFERLMLLLEEAGGHAEGGCDACVTVFSEELRGESLKAAAALREAGWSVDVYPGTGKLKAQFKYADQKRARLAIVIGPDEAAQGQATVKDLRSGEERKETVSALVLRRPSQP